MKNLFEHTSSTWVQYSNYEYRSADGVLYITPTADSTPILYDPLESYAVLVVDALNLGRTATRERDCSHLQADVLAFVRKYGLLGFLTALPTTPAFMDYKQVYLPKNHFIRAESMSTEDYLNLFFPFESLDVVKQGIHSRWNLSGDKGMMALAMTLAGRPTAVAMCCQRQYAERYDWMIQVLQDWAFTFLTGFLYYLDAEKMDDLTKEIFRRGMSAFGGAAPTYHIELRERPTMVWDFHSMLLQIQFMLSVMLTDEHCRVSCCPNCGRVFISDVGQAHLCDKCREES